MSRMIKLLTLLSIIASPTLLHAQKGFFIPNPLVIPVHTQANQLHVSLGIGRGYNLNASYAVTDHLALFASGSLNKGTSKRRGLIGGSRFNLETDDHTVTGGLGYFSAQNPASGLTIETYLGAGKYKANNYWYFVKYGGTETATQAEYWNVFGQLDILTVKRKSEAGIAVKLAYNRYNYFQFYDFNGDPQARNRYENVWSINMEPVGSYSYKWRKLKLNAQVGISFPLLTDYVRWYVMDPATQEERLIDSAEVNSGLGALIGSISLQYNFNFKPGKE